MRRYPARSLEILPDFWIGAPACVSPHEMLSFIPHVEPVMNGTNVQSGECFGERCSSRSGDTSADDALPIGQAWLVVRIHRNKFVVKNCENTLSTKAGKSRLQGKHPEEGKQAVL